MIRALPTAANWRRALRELDVGERDLIAGLSARPQERVAKLAEEGVPGVFVDFGELVGRSYEWCGRPRGLALATELEVVQAVSKACEFIPTDSPFHSSSVYEGFRRRAHATLAELREWGLDPVSLRLAAESAPAALAARLSTLAKIEEEARAILSGLGRTVLSERIKRLLDATSGALEVRPRIVLFCGSEFLPMRLAWVTWAVHAGIETTLILDGHPKAEGLFEGARAIESALQGSSRDAFVRHGFAEHLFAGTRSGGTLRVGAFSAADPLAECEWALRRALEQGGEGDSRSQVAFHCRAMDEYGPLLATAANRFGVPLNLSWREPLHANGLLRAVLATVKALCEDEPSAIEACLGASALSEPADLRQSVERAIRETAYSSGDPFENLRARSQAVEELSPLAAILNWRKTALDQPAPLVVWLGRLSALIESGWTCSAPTLEDRDQAAQAALMEALSTRAVVDAAVEALRVWSLREFASLLDETMRASASSPWGKPTGITVAGRSESLGEPEHVFVLGVLEGVFPRRRSEDPILSDEDRRAISALLPDRPPLPTSHVRARAERDEFVAVCAAAGRSLTFSFPQTEEDRDNVPAFYLAEAKRAAGGSWWEESYPRKLLAPSESQCRAETDRRLARALSGERRRQSPSVLITPSAREAIVTPQESPVSPYDLREVAICPFQYVFHRRLSVRPSTAENPWLRLRRLPQEAGLPSLATPEEARARLEEVLEAELESLRGVLTPAETKLMRSGGKRLIREWVHREFRAREIWPKDPGSVRPHAAFGAEGLAGELPIQGRTVRLRGAVTAVSRMGNYAVAHLANARRSLVESTVDDMEGPDKLELGLYMWALSGARPGAAVEAESLGGQRTLFLLPRFVEQQPQALQNEGLRVVAFDDRREFFTEVKHLLAEATRALSEGELAPCPGDHCRFCDFGELCRSAQGFAEEVPLNIEDAEGD